MSGFAIERARDGEHLLLAAGQLGGLVPALAQDSEVVVDALLGPRALAAGECGEAQVLADREVRKDAPVFGDERDPGCASANGLLLVMSLPLKRIVPVRAAPDP